MDSSFNPPSKHGKIMDDQEDDLDSISSSSSSSSSIGSSHSIESSSSDFMEDATSSSSSSSSSSSDQLPNGPLFEMSSLMQQLPFKRGLSKHFQGKSQSFTSLSNVRCLEDLVKPEKPYKKMKSCKSYGGLMFESHKASSPPKTFSRTISKKASRGSCSSLNAKRSHSLYFNKPPIPPQRTSGLCNQTPLFA